MPRSLSSPTYMLIQSWLFDKIMRLPSLLTLGQRAAAPGQFIAKAGGGGFPMFASELTMNWALSLNLDPNSDGIMPGLKWDFALTDGGYVVIVYGIPAEKGVEVPVYATDDDGNGCRSV